MINLLPTDTAPYSELNATLYRAHVFMITHGAVLCGETPQCHDCPLIKQCEYGSLLRASGKAKAGYADIPPPPPQPPPMADDVDAPSQPQTTSIADLPQAAAVEPVSPEQEAAAEEGSPRAAASAGSSLDTQQASVEADIVMAEGQPAAETAVAEAMEEDKKEDAAAVGGEPAAASSSALNPLDPASLLEAARAVAAAISTADDPEDNDDNNQQHTATAASSSATPFQPLGAAQDGAICQMVYARIVSDETIAPSHPGDKTPRLLLIQSTIGEYAKGRLLLSPWSAFKGVFPMHGTYFFQNEVRVRAALPLSYSPPHALANSSYTPLPPAIHTLYRCLRTRRRAR